MQNSIKKDEERVYCDHCEDEINSIKMKDLCGSLSALCSRCRNIMNRSDIQFNIKRNSYKYTSSGNCTPSAFLQSSDLTFSHLDSSSIYLLGSQPRNSYEHYYESEIEKHGLFLTAIYFSNGKIVFTIYNKRRSLTKLVNFVNEIRKTGVFSFDWEKPTFINPCSMKGNGYFICN
jgi:hypothetical protein